jgi:DNA polymerase-1
LDESGYQDFTIEYAKDPYGDKLAKIKGIIEKSDLVIGFNLKFDLAWLRRYIPTLVCPRIWDCQVIEYSLSGQTHLFPSLRECLEKYGLQPKMSEVADLWESGLDTPEIPLETLLKYQRRDVEATFELYQKQLLHPEYQKLEKYLDVQMRDGLILLDMQDLGLKFNRASCTEHKKEVECHMQELLKKLTEIAEADINWRSPKQVSIYLYGGFIEDVKFDRKIEPDPHTESANTAGKSDEELATINQERAAAKPMKPPLQRVWSVSDTSLNRGKHSKKIKQIIQLLLEYKKYAKLVGTYLEGIPEIVDKMKWKDDMIHGNFNQVATRTGRLSSSNPNLQNFPEEMQRHVISRYT